MALRRSPRFIALLVLVTVLGPLSMQMFLPALPAVQTAFGTDASTVQLTITLAMVAIGVAIVSSGTDHGAYGHAWTEVRQGDRWVVADAALYDEAESEDMQVRYLPLGILEDEGMGYTLTLGAILSRGVQQVEIIGPAQ